MPAMPRLSASIFDKLSLAFVWGCAGAFAAAACFLMYSVVSAGVMQINWEFITQVPKDSGRAGGIGPIIVSTLLIVLVCLTAAVPLGLGTAIYLSGYDSSSVAGRWIRTSLDILGGVPSIVFGLVGSVFFSYVFGEPYSILSGGLTLACMVLPIFIRVAESGIRNVGIEHRHAAMALGLSEWTTVFRIILPAALPSLLAAFTLALTRALAETAALIFTSGSVMRYPESLFDSGRSLSVHIYDMALNVTGGNERAFASAAVLVILLLLINATTHIGVRMMLRK